MTEGGELGSSQSTMHMRNKLCSSLPTGSLILQHSSRPRITGAALGRMPLPQEEGISRLGAERAVCGVSPAISGTPLGWSSTSSFADPWWRNEICDPLDGFPQRSVPFLKLPCFQSLSLLQKFNFEAIRKFGVFNIRVMRLNKKTHNNPEVPLKPSCTQTEYSVILRFWLGTIHLTGGKEGVNFLQEARRWIELC